MPKTEYIDGLNGKSVCAQRAEYTEAGVNIDTALSDLNDSVKLTAGLGVSIASTSQGYRISSVYGNVGAQGPCGPQGATGSVGARGATGQSGPSGACGPRGVQGPCGPCGPCGPSGPKGATGSQGIQGITGARGPCGPSGYQGITGAKGPCGPNGATGSTGAKGPCGPSGLLGATGNRGPCGPKGNTGVTGPTGAKGPCGPSGAKGFASSFSVKNNYTAPDLGSHTPTSSYKVFDSWGAGSRAVLVTYLFYTNKSSAFYVNVMIKNTTDGTYVVHKFRLISKQIEHAISVVIANGKAYQCSIQLASGTADTVYFKSNYLVINL